LPWPLREAAHTVVTEGVAMWFGRLARDANWLRTVGVPDELASTAAREGREAQIVFARWALMVTAFERGLYADPGQDLDGLWWRLSDELQGVERPPDWQGGDWASKVHVACWPAYYHGYALGELFASQFDATLGQADARPPADAGPSLRNLMAQGQAMPWRTLIRHATGDDLSASPWLARYGGSAT
jgi:peptidyl-dipeptidase A